MVLCGSPFESRQGSDLLAGLPLRHADFKETLQIQPELRRCAEEMPKAQCGVAGNRSSAAKDFSNAIGWHFELASKIRSAETEFFQLFGEMFSGVNRGYSPTDFLSGLAAAMRYVKRNARELC